MLDRCDNQLRHRPSMHWAFLNLSFPFPVLSSRLFAGNSISDHGRLMATSRLQELALHYGFLALATTRLTLCFTDAPRLLKQDHLVSSPLTSFSNRASYAKRV